MNNISAVIHNRMQKNWKLELDSTITYLEGAVKGFTDPNKWDAFRNNNNTYKCTGLPATPICNPGMNAIQAALSPTEASYLFFCSDKKTGVYYYADTYEEHQQNEIKAGPAGRLLDIQKGSRHLGACFLFALISRRPFSG